MNKWGIFNWNLLAGLASAQEKFAEYGITIIDRGGGDVNFAFSDGVNATLQPQSGSRLWIVNDEKHVCMIIRDGAFSIPKNSYSATFPIEVFPNGIIPLINGGIYSCNEVNSGQSTNLRANIPAYTIQDDPISNDLILYPLICKPRGEADSVNNIYTKILVCAQRQFTAGSIIKAANGDSYISLGSWLLIKM